MVDYHEMHYDEAMILGIDEVGRGVWAGPLVVGAVVLGTTTIEGITDSKALSKKRRESLHDEIVTKASATGLGWVSAEEIDEIGLSNALCEATKRAVREVQARHVSFHEIIIDGTVNFLRDTSLESYVSTMKKADLLISSVSAASIVAKVARDRYMTEQAVQYPEYAFESHVGYGTAAHRAAIDRYGVTPLHRLSIAPLANYRSNRANRLGPTIPTTREVGNASEEVATRELERQGHEIVARNWKTRLCEIDIVSQHDGVYYFTEVKHRKNNTGGDGLAAITPAKLRQMTLAARLYAHRYGLRDIDMRLQAIATSGDPPECVARVEC